MKWFQCPDGGNINHPSPLFKKPYQAAEHLEMAGDSELVESGQSKRIFGTERPSHKRFAYTRRGSGRNFENMMWYSRNLEVSDVRGYIYTLLNLTECPILDVESRYEAEQLDISIDYSLSLS